ncbi:MAG: hypothetical protein ACK4FB_05035 [Brevundimonas sp.]|uniref:hypothetical protein n=1 Tax=Brevundimonas sp. TaxID=1871086 RepID=UPI00391A4D5B
MLRFELEMGKAHQRRLETLVIHSPVRSQLANAWEARIECSDDFVPSRPIFGATAFQAVENAIFLIRELAANKPPDETITLEDQPFVLRVDDRIY